MPPPPPEPCWRKRPDDAQALKDYNFAVGRIFEVIHDSGLQPWKSPLICPGASGDWNFSMTHDGKPEHDPSHFRILPADRYQFKGTLVRERTRQRRPRRAHGHAPA